LIERTKLALFYACFRLLRTFAANQRIKVMKQVILLLCSFFACLPYLSAQEEIPAGVAGAFRKGSATELSGYLCDKVDLIIQNQTHTADKPGTVTLLTQFFTENKVNSFSVNHDGKRDDSSFLIGTLATAGGPYRVNVLFKKVQTKFLIHQIRIDKINE
jgi:hypothetical protein